MARTLKIKQLEPPIATEIIAGAIVAIADSIRKLRNGRLNERALLVLIKSAAGDTISQRDIKIVLNSIEDLERAFLRKAGAK